MNAFALTTSLLFCLAATLTAQDPPDDRAPALGSCLEGLDYPYPVSHWQFSAQGQSLQMACMDLQPTGKANGLTVLLLHGKNFSGSYWGAVMAELAQAGCRVIVPDQIGFGKSTKPANFQFTFHQLAQNTRALLDQLKVTRVVVVGHSMGGMLATRFALMFPDRTQALVLTNPIGLEDWQQWVPHRTVDEWYQEELKQTREKMQAYQRTSYYHGTWRSEYDRWLDQAVGWVKSPDYPRIAWNSALTYDMIFTQPVVHDFSRVHAPVLLIIGQLDRTALGKAWAPKEFQDKLGNYPQLGRKAAAAFPNARLAALEGIGHIPHIEDPARFYAALLPFLATIRGQETSR